MIIQLVPAVLAALAITTKAEAKRPSRNIGLIYPPEDVNLQVGELTAIGVTGDDPRILGIRRHVFAYVRFPNGTEVELFETYDGCEGMGAYPGTRYYGNLRLDQSGKCVKS